MTAKDVYANLGEDYDEVLSRLMSEERITKYLKKFVVEDYTTKMKESIASKNWEEAFRIAHSLKGMGMNMGTAKLYNSCETLCDALRTGEPTVDITDMVSLVSAEYAKIVEQVALL